MVMCPLLTVLEVETDQHGCPNWTVLFCFSLTIIQERMNKHYIVVKKKNRHSQPFKNKSFNVKRLSGSKFNALIKVIIWDIYINLKKDRKV